MTDPNARFDGSIPEIFDRHLGPLLFEPYAADLACRLPTPPPARVLEIACGSGILTHALRSALPADAELVATDLSGAMVALAQKRLSASSRLVFREADACDLPFAEQQFDLAACQFGLMFFPDKEKALRETRRVLRSGGHVLFSVWDALERNPVGRIAHETITKFFPANPPDFYPVPFSLHERTDLRRMFAAGGFSAVTVDPVPLEGRSTSARDVAFGLVFGNPVAAAIRERGMSDPTPVVDALTVALERLGGREPFRVPMQALVIAGRAP